MKKANNREELTKMLSAPMKEALNILKENNMHGVVNIFTDPDADYIFFSCLGADKFKEALCDARNAYKEQTNEGE